MKLAVRKQAPSFFIEAVRKQFPGLDKGTICMNNGAGALVYKGVMDRYEKTTFFVSI